MKTFFNAVLICLIMIPATMFAQTTVTGTVTDKADAMPLPGVNVLIKGTSRGASTDFDGKYSIEVNQGETIVISYVGYRTQEIIFNGQATIDVSLEEDAAQLFIALPVRLCSVDTTKRVVSLRQRFFSKLVFRISFLLL